MKRRSLLDRNGKVLGQVEVNGDRLTLSGDAGPLFQRLIDQFGRKKTGDYLIKDGWSNGYARLGDIEEE